MQGAAESSASLSTLTLAGPARLGLSCLICKMGTGVQASLPDLKTKKNLGLICFRSSR